MANYVVFDDTGKVVNVVVLNAGSTWEPPAGHTVVAEAVYLKSRGENKAKIALAMVDEVPAS
jgi:hypothetical protein